MRKSKNFSSDDYSSSEELECDITSELQLFFDSELGLDQSRYEFDARLEPCGSGMSFKYTATVRLLDPDGEEFLDVFSDNTEELYDHLSFKFPRVRFNITLEASGASSELDSSSGFDDEEELLVDQEDSEDEDDEQTLEEQYEEEGLHVVDDIEETNLQVFERGVDDEDDDDDDEDEDEEDEKPRRRRKSELEEELEDIDLEDEEDEDYIPDAEDREELWKAFGDFDE